MRGILTWALVAMVAVLLQGAAKVGHILKDEGMADDTMEKRQIAVSASVVAISTEPEGLVYGPFMFRAKDGILVYKVTLKNNPRVKVMARYADGSSKELTISYPLKWQPARQAQVAAKTKGNSSGGSQPSKPVYSPPPAKPWLAEGNLNSWELSGNLVQDTRGWFADTAPGTMTQGNSALRGTFQVSRGIGVFGEIAGSLTQDRSANWETTAFLGQNLAGFGGGLTFLALPRTTLSVGVRYYIDIPMGFGAVNSPNLFAEVKGNDGSRLSYSVKLSSNAFKDVGVFGKITAKIHDNWGVSTLGVAKRYAIASTDAQVGAGVEWFPTASDSSSVGAYIMTPTTTTAPPAAGLTFGIKF